MSVKIKKEIQKIENDIIGYRRNFHQYPELSFKEFKTADTICNHLDRKTHFDNYIFLLNLYKIQCPQ